MRLWLQQTGLSACHLPLWAGSGPHRVSTPQAHSEWEAAEQRSRADLAQWREEAEAHLQEVQEKVDSLPRQVGAGWAASPPPLGRL